jgi:hypothetical protein
MGDLAKALFGKLVVLAAASILALRGSAGGNSLAKPPPRLRLDAWQCRLDARTLRGRLGACEGASSSQAHVGGGRVEGRVAESAETSDWSGVTAAAA